MSKWDSYRNLARVYDRLMDDVDYGRWLDYARRIWGDRKPETVVDLACGTGTMAKMLAQQGFRVIGVDISEDMLAVAEEKSRGLDVRYLHQDMRALTLSEPVDTVVCFFDSINYLLEEEDVVRTFEQVFAQLEEGGTFLFDVHTPYKIREIFADNAFHMVDEDVSYIWQCESDPDSLVVEHDLTLFVREPDGVYRRFDEIHRQRAYEPEKLECWLKQAGFRKVSVTADFGGKVLGADDDRAFFAAYK